MKNWQRSYVDLLIIIILIACFVFKAILLFADVFPFNSDEAIVALMAKHILNGERPIFFYGQVYMGSLDAFLVAAGFFIFGEKVWVIRFVQCVLYGFVLLTSFWIGQAGLGQQKAGYYAAALLAIPPVSLTLYTTVSLGGYGEALLIGNLLILTAYRIISSQDNSLERCLWAAWSFLAGAGFWINGLTLVYTIPSGIGLLVFLIRSGKWKKYSLLLTGFLSFLFGASPWILGSILQGGISLSAAELLGSAVRQTEINPWQVLGSRLLNFFVLGLPTVFGFRPPWGIYWLAIPLIPIVLAIWLGIISWTISKINSCKPGWELNWMLMGVGAVTFIGFMATPFGNDPSGRYFLPMIVTGSVFAGWAVSSIEKGWWKWGILAALMIYQLTGNIQCAVQMPPGFTTQFDSITVIDHRKDEELIRFLKEKGERSGYSNYWVSYPLAFLSDEQLIFIPRLPYHQDFRFTLRDDRYAPYRQVVEDSSRIAYIVTNHPALEEKLRTGFMRLEVEWREHQIGDYKIFYEISRSVRPEELGL